MKTIQQAAALTLAFAACAPPALARGIEVQLPAASAAPVTGRLIVVVARKDTPEPRLTATYKGSQLFGMDVTGLKPGATVKLDDQALGFPLAAPSELPQGDYHVQAILNVYREFKRSDGHTVWLPPRAEGLPFQLAPGNLYSETAKLTVGAKRELSAKLALTKVIPPVAPPQDTEWIKHVRIKSELLSRFWGAPMHLQASVLLPKGYEAHPQARYPVVFVHVHGAAPFSFNPDPASNTQEAAASAAASRLKTGYEFYQEWNSDHFPRFIAVSLQQPSPYFPDAYSVNSANNGPQNDAVMKELIPHLESRFRMLAKPYARLLEGASTGGWQTLSQQLRHPDFFGGAWIFNPDPIDFSRHQLLDIYKDDNAFRLPVGDWRGMERPMRRSTEGQVDTTVREMSRFEAVLGSRERSGYQFNCWEAVFGPVGPDGYPVPLWDKLTGKLDRKVAEYWRDNGYDLLEYTKRNWPTLGPKLIGKLHFFAGEMDNFYLNLGVYRFEEFLRATENPHYAGRFEYGRPMQGHSWHLTNWAGMLREMAEHVKQNAPPGEDVRQWNY